MLDQNALRRFLAAGGRPEDLGMSIDPATGELIEQPSQNALQGMLSQGNAMVAPQRYGQDGNAIPTVNGDFKVLAGEGQPTSVNLNPAIQQVHQEMQQRQPQGMSSMPGQSLQGRPMRAVGAGNGSLVELSPEVAPSRVELDYSRPPVDVPGVGKVYYDKSGTGAYAVDGSGNPTAKVYLGYDLQGSMALNKATLDQAQTRQQIAQSQASVAHTNEEIRASKVNNPDWLGMEGSPMSPGATGGGGTIDLSNVPPGILAQAQAMANGDMAIPSTRSGKLSPIAAIAFQINPSLKQTDYAAKQGTIKDFATGGKSGQVVQAINQALHHASTVSDAIDELNNSNTFPALVNPVVNMFEQKVMGDTRLGKFQTAAMALSEELKKIYAGGGGSLTELQTWQKAFDPNAGQEQQRAYLAQGMNLLQGAIQSRQEAYQRGMGPSADFGSLFTPQALEALQKLQGKGYVGGVQAPQPSAQAQPTSSVPPAAVAFLKQNPAAAADFDRKYGAGMAAKVLGR